MKERPILFSDTMVRAILDGRKTQTRRVIPERLQLCQSPEDEPKTFVDWCRYGKPGDRLWVREAFQLDGSLFYRADGGMTEADLETVQKTRAEWKWRSPIHMPRTFARMVLEIVAVRVERLREISETDAEAEGIHLQGLPEEERYNHPRKHIHAFAEIWDLINAKRGYTWESNPWVWVIEFKRVI